jgi:ketosteroid isomerase-like protein
MREGDSASVWRIEGQQIRQVAVKLGERDARRGEFPVLTGLAAGDRVLRKADRGLVDGQRLELAVAPARAAPAISAAPSAAPSAAAAATASR